MRLTYFEFIKTAHKSPRHFLKSASNAVSSYPCPGIRVHIRVPEIRVHIRVPGIRVLISVSLWYVTPSRVQYAWPRIAISWNPRPMQCPHIRVLGSASISVSLRSVSISVSLGSVSLYPWPWHTWRPRGFNMRDLESPFPEIRVQCSVLISVSWDPRPYPCPWDPCPDIRVSVIRDALAGSICVTSNRHFLKSASNAVSSYPCPGIRVHIRVLESVSISVSLWYVTPSRVQYAWPRIAISFTTRPMQCPHIRVLGSASISVSLGSVSWYSCPDIRVPVIRDALASSICVTSNHHFLKSASNAVSSYPCPGIRVHIRVPGNRVPGIRVLISVYLWYVSPSRVQYAWLRIAISWNPRPMQCPHIRVLGFASISVSLGSVSWYPWPCDTCRPRGFNMRDLESPFPEIRVPCIVFIFTTICMFFWKNNRWKYLLEFGIKPYTRLCRYTCLRF